MYTTKFEPYKLRRELRREGTVWNAARKPVNDYGEPTGIPVIYGNITALYHEENSSVELVQLDTTIVRTEKTPMLLCLFSDYERLSPQVGDIFTCAENGKRYTFNGAVDIMNWGIAADITLEVVDTGAET